VTAPPPPALTWAGAVMALRAIYSAYGGWHTAVYFSEEVHAPERNVARATFSGIALVGVLYLLVNAAVLYVLPLGALAKSNLAVADAARVVLGPWSERAVTGLAMISVAAICNLQVMLHVRTTFAMGRNGVFPPGLARVARGGTPRWSLLVVLVFSVGFAASGVYETLLSIYAPLAMLTFLLLGLAVMRLRRREPDLPRPWKMPLYPLPALFSIGLNVLLLVVFLSEDWKDAAWSVGLLLLPLPLYIYGARRWRGALA
jgi:APA family basic amino acid/polyamine antiporter